MKNNICDFLCKEVQNKGEKQRLLELLKTLAWSCEIFIRISLNVVVGKKTTMVDNVSVH